MTRYEGMFIVDYASAANNLADVLAQIRKILEKHGAHIKSLDRWAERRLAYAIKKQTRGVYILADFEAPAPAVHAIRAECRITELILRVMILKRVRPVELKYIVDASHAIEAPKEVVETQETAAVKA